ncbi:MAG: DUF5329 family protein [Betaproteobacteria bacterium]|nr:DUF5329 family protein [Betaproteobacteria bacterium]
MPRPAGFALGEPPRTGTAAPGVCAVGAHGAADAAGCIRRLLPLLLSCGFVAAVAAAPLSSTARAEIDSLLSRLESSACEFNRNGTWHTAAEAKTHLLRKLKYLEDRDLVRDTEQFVERAAATSSITGQDYLVRCARGTPVSSRSWLLSQLQLLRAATPVRSVP